MAALDRRFPQGEAGPLFVTVGDTRSQLTE
jgi:hypothetical protein